MEIWDLYHRDGTPAGRTHPRSGELPDGLYHIVCSVILRHADGDFLLMQRDPNKLTHPLRWELTAGGSVLSGETPEACARRELFEETGFDVPELREIASRARDDNHIIYHCYLATTDGDKRAVTLQPEETVAWRWVDLAGLQAFIDAGGAIRSQLVNYAPYLRGELGLAYDL